MKTARTVNGGTPTCRQSESLGTDSHVLPRGETEKAPAKRPGAQFFSQAVKAAHRVFSRARLKCARLAKSFLCLRKTKIAA
jgi:hypothetical protein